MEKAQRTPSRCKAWGKPMSPNQGSRVLFGSGSSPRVQHRIRSAHQLCSAHGVQPRLWYEQGNEVQGLRKHYEEEWKKKKKGRGRVQYQWSSSKRNPAASHLVRWATSDITSPLVKILWGAERVTSSRAAGGFVPKWFPNTKSPLLWDKGIIKSVFYQ